MTFAAFADDRAVLRIGGADRVTFLQGLVSNDVTKAAEDTALWCAFLTPQGKYLHDFFLSATQDALLLEGERTRLPDLARRLALYKLRSAVDITPAGDSLRVALLWGDGAAASLGLPERRGAARPFSDGVTAGGVAYVDPRLAEAGLRLLLPADRAAQAIADTGATVVTPARWDRLRLSLGLPDGSRDLEPEKAILLENGFDELGGIDWQKGCYMGQELTARTRYRGLVKKRLMPVSVDGPLPPPGTPVLLGEADAGQMRSGCDGLGLALLRLEAMEAVAAGAGRLHAGEAILSPLRPTWMQGRE